LSGRNQYNLLELLWPWFVVDEH